MTSRRDIRAQRRHAEQRDHSWQEARDEDQQSEERPDDEYGGLDEASRLAQEFRQ